MSARQRKSDGLALVAPVKAEVSSVRLTHVDERPPMQTAVVYLHPSEAGVSPSELAVLIATRLEGIAVLERASVNVSGETGRATATVRCAGVR